MNRRLRLLFATAALAAAVAAGLAWWMHDPRYFPAREVDKGAYPLQRIDLEPPPAPPGVEYFGRLRIDLYIGRSGRVDRLEVVESTLPPALRERYVAAFAGARWQPARRQGRDVRSVKRVEVEIEPPGEARRLPMRPDS